VVGIAAGEEEVIDRPAGNAVAQENAEGFVADEVVAVQGYRTGSHSGHRRTGDVVPELIWEDNQFPAWNKIWLPGISL